MANFCLPNDRVNAFITAMKSGQINPTELSAMSSAERNALFKEIAGDDKVASLINAEFESKLLLKNQQAGMIRWAKNLTDTTPQVKADLVDKISKLDKALSPTEQGQFLSDLAAKKLGFEVTDLEAKTITELSQQVQKLGEKKLADGTFASEADRLAYGNARVNMADYVNDLRVKAEGLKKSDLARPGQYGKIITKGAGNLKSIAASLDLSASLRQGGKVLLTNPNVWRRNILKQFDYVLKEFRGKDALKAVNADIVSRPNADLYRKAKLAVYKAEEAFPESTPEKIPGFGRLFKASESAYTGFLYKTRADLFDQYVTDAAKAGVNINDPQQLQAMAKVINSLTGRAHLGRLEQTADVVNNFFFSPRYLKANFDVLTANSFDAGMTGFARKKAATNLVKTMAGMGSFLLAANTIRPGAVDWDPRSTDFLKIKIGNTRFDITGGAASMLVFMSRLATGESKSSSGTIKNLRDPEYGGQTAMDVFSSFFRNKLSPAAAIATDVITGQDNLGNPTTLEGEVYKGLTPIGVQNAIEVMQDPNSANKAAAILADFFGVATNTYGNKSPDSWSKSSSKTLKQFKEKVGEEKFKQANQEFSDQYNAFVANIVTNDRYKKLSEDDKQTVLTTKQNAIKDELFKKYNFEYKKTERSKSAQATIDALTKK